VEFFEASFCFFSPRESEIVSHIYIAQSPTFPNPAVFVLRLCLLCNPAFLTAILQHGSHRPQTPAPVCKNFGEDRTCSSEDMIADRQTHRHAHHNTPLRHRGGGGRSNKRDCMSVHVQLQSGGSTSRLQTVRHSAVNFRHSESHLFSLSCRLL